MTHSIDMAFKPIRLPLSLASSLLLGGLLASSPAHADRCKANAEGRYTCTYQEIKHPFVANSGKGCNGKATTRNVRWQVPEGTPPAEGWPVVFYYNGTVLFNSPATKPFTSTSTSFGAHFAEEGLHEFLDDPRGTGRKYAVFAPEAPGGNFIQAWDTNGSGDYASKDDYCFLPSLFNGVSSGVYGAASQYNMGKRFALGISSGGYNTSRMAVTFNADSQWSALVIVSGSYATCLGPFCKLPDTLPANHPPTKFYHGTKDLIVGISTMRPYFERLKSEGFTTEKVEHGGGHAFSKETLGEGGVKAWFDRF